MAKNKEIIVDPKTNKKIVDTNKNNMINVRMIDLI
jgi:hypothetical protein